ncbi:MAG TPA: hypothetical protein VGJ14_20870 [Sporichthyaceae bacterium]|jgi:hypothetical protein
MSPGRSNGLPAVRYTPLVDLQPHFADALLEALRAEGVAAYAAPAPGRRGPYMDVILPDRPTDRVWVDAAAEADARALLESRRGEFSEPPARATVPASMTEAEDAAWQAIVAGWEQNTTDPVPPWPVAEDVVAGEAQAEPAAVRPGSHADDEPLVVQEIPRPPVEADDPEDHFVPPPPPPLPRLEPRTKLAWLGVFLGPIYLVARAWFGIDLFYGASVLILAAFIGGAVSLIYRMKDDGRDEIDPDNGAVV